MQGIFQKENTDKALKYGIYRHLPTYEKIIRNLVSFFTLKSKFAKSGVNHTTENHITIQHLVKAACRRNKIKDPDAKEQEKIEKVLENREKEVLNQFVNLSDIIRSMIETINEKIPDPRKWNRRLKATLFIKKFNEAVS